ncbi:type II toxin-antitoxin system Phd/YefM family antitoxin [bacterium]|nr:type II toxin-antitoxin system Phd/YefM family antitoxin [bacterium]MCI0613520.1 type II toxin-antitoxin system Phd/YefM family antitoxin [bacterium]
MKTMTATEVARNFRKVLDSLQNGTEEIIIVRNNQAVAKLLPGAPKMTALEALSDIYKTIPAQEGDSWLKDAKRGSRKLRKELRNPWR